MDLSGIIFVVLAVAWAGYLIPKALRQHDELARTRSIDQFSASTRVLARREPVNDRDTRLVVRPGRPARSTHPVASPAPVAAPSTVATSAVPVGSTTTARAAARTPARRRRRLLGLLLLCVLGTAAAAALGYTPPWAAAAPGGVALLFLALCRVQVRREARQRRQVAGHARQAPAAVDVDAVPHATHEPAAEQPPVEGPVPSRAHVPTQRTGGESLEVEEVTGPPVGLGSLWDPLPVTLPTYVTAPKAHRTVRTIALGEPGTWTSGRTAQDAEIAVQAAAPDSPEGTGRHAVGS